ncbi:hypothetical protein RUND412_002470 [Rhizina undulata]
MLMMKNGEGGGGGDGADGGWNGKGGKLCVLPFLVFQLVGGVVIMGLAAGLYGSPRSADGPDFWIVPNLLTLIHTLLDLLLYLTDHLNLSYVLVLSTLMTSLWTVAMTLLGLSAFRSRSAPDPDPDPDDDWVYGITESLKRRGLMVTGCFAASVVIATVYSIATITLSFALLRSKTPPEDSREGSAGKALLSFHSRSFDFSSSRKQTGNSQTPSALLSKTTLVNVPLN